MIIGDEPIKEAKYDVIGRLHLAKAIAAEIRKLDASSGMVIGILGPLGIWESLVNRSHSQRTRHRANDYGARL